MFAKIKTNFRDRNTSHSLETSTCDPFKYKMGSPILIVSICMGKLIKKHRIKMGKMLLLFQVYFISPQGKADKVSL